MSEPDFLYGLLPTVYRQTDLKQGWPLRALFAILQEQHDRIESDIATLHDNWFVETCEPWALAYLADLVGSGQALARVRGGVDTRRLVANTLAYRRRRGSASTLEHIVEDVTGWPTRVVDGADIVAMTPTVRRLRPQATGSIADRRGRTLADLGGPFDAAARTAAVRSNGVANIGRVGIFLWRLRSYPVRSVVARAVAGQGCFTFHPAGQDMPLFNRCLSRDDVDRQVDARNVPVPLTRRMLAAELAEPVRDRAASLLESDRSAFAVYLIDPTASQSRIRVRPQEFVIADLGAWSAGFGSDKTRVAVDPERGRLMLTRQEDCDGGVAVVTDHCYGLAGDIGGGPYFYPAEHEPAQWQARVGTVPPAKDEERYYASIGEALQAWVASDDVEGDEDGLIEIVDSGTYDFADDAHAHAAQTIIRLGGRKRRLTIRAAAQQRSCLIGTIAIEATAPDTAITFEGLLICGGIETTGPMRVVLRHCTVRGHDQFALVASAQQSDGLSVTLESTLSGPVRMPQTSSLKINASIIDGGGQSALSAPNGSRDGHARAGRVEDRPRDAGPATVATCATILGPMSVVEIEASDTVFTAPVSVTRTHKGFVRHCYVPGGSHTPSRYACQPSIEEQPSNMSAAALAAHHLHPRFTSVQFGRPGYGQLGASCDRAIASGASNGSEMGAFNGLDDRRRAENLRAALDEHMPIGLEPVAIYVT